MPRCVAMVARVDGRRRRALRGARPLRRRGLSHSGLALARDGRAPVIQARFCVFVQYLEVTNGLSLGTDPVAAAPGTEPRHNSARNRT